ncbi:hypothetical protein BC936DRAFT_149748 [Jimgerdemannia flammicorona]|uniref:Uncharacterized protein n=1 Tax=Jimgerdemannia flammicorona TaxID=994334 RepID=A0A433DJX3_9FUNG|nr:hypothetical protein BC936DRAFT_149748 [Jimgerdemannia flammicorona]
MTRNSRFVSASFLQTMALAVPAALATLLFLYLTPLTFAFVSDSISADQTMLQAPTIRSFVPQLWEVLGPFPTGMREQDFGADPLEAFGGFANLPFSIVDRYPSELADNGTVGWFTIKTGTDGKTVGPIPFKGVRWSFNQLSQGWAVNQFQAWARSRIVLARATTLRIQCTSVGDFHVGVRLFSGDWYGYGVTAHTLRLPAGKHEFRVRIVNEIRIFGGTVPPTIVFRCEIEEVADEVKACMREKAVVVPDVVEGVLAGRYVSVTVENLRTEVGNEGWMDVVRVEVDGKDSDSVKFYAVPAHPNSFPLRLAPSQSRPLVLEINFTSSPLFSSGTTLSTRLKIYLRSSDGTFTVLFTPLILTRRTWGEAFKFTFLDFDGTKPRSFNHTFFILPKSTIQTPKTTTKAMAIPPRKLFRPSTDSSIPPPIVVALHGAGVEAESSFWTGAYRRQKAAWILYPTGRTPWGFDWHGPSHLNVQSALRALVKMPQVFAKLEFGGGSWAVGEEGRSHRTNTDRRELIPSIDHRSADSRIQGIATVARVHGTWLAISQTRQLQVYIMWIWHDFIFGILPLLTL